MRTDCMMPSLIEKKTMSGWNNILVPEALQSARYAALGGIRNEVLIRPTATEQNYFLLLLHQTMKLNDLWQSMKSDQLKGNWMLLTGKLKMNKTASPLL